DEPAQGRLQRRAALADGGNLPHPDARVRAVAELQHRRAAVRRRRAALYDGADRAHRQQPGAELLSGRDGAAEPRGARGRPHESAAAVNHAVMSTCVPMPAATFANRFMFCSADEIRLATDCPDCASMRAIRAATASWTRAIWAATSAAASEAVSIGRNAAIPSRRWLLPALRDSAAATLTKGHQLRRRPDLATITINSLSKPELLVQRSLLWRRHSR